MDGVVEEGLAAAAPKLVVDDGIVDVIVWYVLLFLGDDFAVVAVRMADGRDSALRSRHGVWFALEGSGGVDRWMQSVLEHRDSPVGRREAVNGFWRGGLTPLM